LNTVGRHGENAAFSYLKKKGYKLVTKNFSCRFGEIDLIVSDKSYIVFVEVKTRKSDAMIEGIYSINTAKIKRLTATAQIYLSKYPTKLQPRFDVIEVEMKNNEYYIKRHIENAF